MATRETVAIQPGVLEWARITAGLSEGRAATALKVTRDTITSWETEVNSFGISELRRIASAYRRPVSALLQPIAPEYPKLPEDFRTIASSEPLFSPETMVAIRDAQRIQEAATDLLDGEPAIFPQSDIPRADSDRDDPLVVGLELRRALGIDIRVQFGWSSPNQAFNAWRSIFQELGIIVLAKEMPREDCRGFSLNSVPVIVVNSREADQAKIFTLAHEYAHLSLKRSGVCLERDYLEIERWCNQCAASFLVPQHALVQEVSRSTAPLLEQVQPLAYRFKVSRHVIALRLVELELAGRDLYEAIKEEDSQRGDWEKPTISKDEEFLGRPQEAVRLSEVGVGYANIVLSALESSRISPFDASEMLDVRLDKLEPLRRRVESALGRTRR